MYVYIREDIRSMIFRPWIHTAGCAIIERLVPEPRVTQISAELEPHVAPRWDGVARRMRHVGPGPVISWLINPILYIYIYTQIFVDVISMCIYIYTCN